MTRSGRGRFKGSYAVLALLIIVGGAILQFNWMKHAKQEDVVSNAFVEKLGEWMLHQKGLAPEKPGEALGIETIACEYCLGTGSVLGEDGAKSLCPICLGVGSHVIRRFDPADRICPLCAGMGRTRLPDSAEYGTCPRCGGRGLVRSQAAAEDAAAGAAK